MRAVVTSVTVTSDDKPHLTPLAARKHAQKRYVRLLSSLSTKLYKCEHHSDLHSYIDEHLNDFLRLKALLDDAQTLTDVDGKDLTWVEADEGRTGQFM